MICPKCGAQNMDGVTFCGSCGAQLPSHIPPIPEEPYQNVNYSQQYQQPQQPYQQSPPPVYGAPSAGSGNFPPKNYMTEAIIVTTISFLCCCSLISTILGIIAIVKANSVNSEFAKGNFHEANNNANAAKKLTIWAAIVSVVFVVIGTILYVLFFAAVINEAGGWNELLNM